jgi:uncharacterized protein (TIGR00106 family)
MRLAESQQIRFDPESSTRYLPYHPSCLRQQTGPKNERYSTWAYDSENAETLKGRIDMKVIADLTVVPIGVGVSLSRYVVACEEILRDSGLKTQLHAYGTNIEGEWDDVFGAVKRCHEVLHEMGVPRISTTVRAGTRTDQVQTMEDKVESVARKMVPPGENADGG